MTWSFFFCLSFVWLFHCLQYGYSVLFFHPLKCGMLLFAAVPWGFAHDSLFRKFLPWPPLLKHQLWRLLPGEVLSPFSRLGELVCFAFFSWSKKLMYTIHTHIVIILIIYVHIYTYIHSAYFASISLCDSSPGLQGHRRGSASFSIKKIIKKF